MSTRVESVGLTTHPAGQIIRAGANGGDDYFYLRILDPKKIEIAFHMHNYPICKVELPVDGTTILREGDMFRIKMVSRRTSEIVEVPFQISSLHLVDSGELTTRGLPGYRMTSTTEGATAGNNAPPPYLTLL